MCHTRQATRSTAGLRSEVQSERAGREVAEARVKELGGKLRETEAQLAAALGGDEFQDPTSAANAALSAALSDAAGKDAALAEARSQCAALQNQLRQAEYAARDAHAHASVTQAAAEAENQQLRHRVQAAEAELARHSDANSLSQQLAASQDALAAVRAEVAGLSDELHVMRAAASASGRDADLVADAAAAHAKVTMLLVREARLQRALDTASATEQALRRELQEAGAAGGEEGGVAHRGRALAYIDQIKRLRLANEELESRLTRKAEALAEAAAEAAAAVAERDVTKAQLERLMAEIGGEGAGAASADVSAGNPYAFGGSGGMLRLRTETEEEAIGRVAAAAQATITRLQRACNEKDALLARSQAAAAQQRADAAATAAAARAEIERLSDALLAANDASIAGFRRALEHSGEQPAAAAPRHQEAQHSHHHESDRHAGRGTEELRALLAEKDAQIQALKLSMGTAHEAAAGAVRERDALRSSLDAASHGATKAASSLATVKATHGTVERLKAMLADKDVRVANLQADVNALQAQLRDALEAAMAAAAADAEGPGVVPHSARVSTAPPSESSERPRTASSVPSRRVSLSVDREALRAQVQESLRVEYDAALAAERKRADGLLVRVGKLQAALASAQQARADALAAVEKATQASVKPRGLPPRPPADGDMSSVAAAAQKHYEEAVKQRRRADGLQAKLNETEAALAAAQARLDRMRAASAAGGAKAPAAGQAASMVMPMLQALHDECEAAHARASQAESQLAVAHAEQQARVSIASSADGLSPGHGELGALRAALAAKEVALVQAQSALDVSTSRCARLTSRLESLFNAAASGQVKAQPAGARATSPGRRRGASNVPDDAAAAPEGVSVARAAALARQSASLALAQRTVGRLQKENAKLQAEAQELQSRLLQAEVRLAEAEAKAAREDALLAAAAEANARCDALQQQLADAAAAAAARDEAGDAPAEPADVAPDARTSSSQRVSAGRLATPRASLAGSVVSQETHRHGAASPGVDLDLRRRMAALEAALAHARAECARVEEENADLRDELNALDPGFFDEVDRLKAKATAQEDVLLRYESLLRQYADALGLPFSSERPL